MSVVQFGTIPLVAVASFLLGKIWHHSELVLLGRQRAYAEFLRRCMNSEELRVVEAPEIEKTLAQLREISAEITLYGSNRVNEAVEDYLRRLGFLIGAHGLPSSEIKDEMATASRQYEEMIQAMRHEALGWSVFAVSDLIRGWKKTKATK